MALDFITKLPLSQGYDSILTITDHSCTKMVQFIPCCETITAKDTAHLFLDSIFRHYGLPHKIISNRDARFTSKFIQELCRVLGIQQNISLAYHPRTKIHPNTRALDQVWLEGHNLKTDQPTAKLAP